MQRSIPLTLALALVCACTSEPAADDEAGTTTSPGTSDADESSDDSASVSTSNDEDPTVGTFSTSSSADVDDHNDTSVFLPGDDSLAAECDAFVQDCPQGEKCVPYHSETEGGWDSLKCVPVLGDQAPGEPCISDGRFESTDDCDETSWCYDIDHDGTGTCHVFCGGSPDMPECPAMSACTYDDGEVMSICMATCDPIAQDCPAEEGCHWTGEDFWCLFDAGGEIPAGEPCDVIEDCLAGSYCLDASFLPVCNAASCCTPFCDLLLGDAQCAALPGTTCESFFEQGQAPPQYVNVGVCILPL